MEAYKPPESDLTTNEKMPFKPVKAILLGLLVSIVLLIITGIVVAMFFTLISGIDFSDDKAFETLTRTNTIYMLVDIITTIPALYFAGKIVNRYAPEKEILFGIILSILILLIVAIMLYEFGSFSDYPLWYNAGSLLIIPVAIYFGSRPRTKNTPTNPV